MLQIVALLLAACLFPIAAASALRPRQSPEPNCNPSCPSTGYPPGYAVVYSGTFGGILFCEVGPNGEYDIECAYNSDGTLNDDISTPIDQCPPYATCQNSRRRSKTPALPVPARREALKAGHVDISMFGNGHRGKERITVEPASSGSL